MRLYLHNKILNGCMYQDFWYSMEDQLPALIENLFGDTVKEVQLYDDFFCSDGAYPFIDDIHFYYPLSVIFKKSSKKTNGLFQIVWLKWKKDELKTPNSDQKNPFGATRRISLEITKDVPTAFTNIIQKKKTLFYDRSKQMLVCSWKDFARDKFGMVSQSFLDVLGYQISAQLRELVPQNKITKNWTLRISGHDHTIRHEEWFYRPVTILNSQAEALTFAVKWQEPLDITSDITNDDIRFVIVDHCPKYTTQSFEDLKQLLTHGTYLFTNHNKGSTVTKADIEYSLQHILNCEVEWDSAWPDVVCELQFAELPSKSEIANIFAESISAYNRQHRKPIHYVEEPVANENVVQIIIDFGSADIRALDFLVKKIKKAKWSLKKISFC